MRVLVTGAAGQLGHDVMDELKKRGHEGIGVDVQEMDITDAEKVRQVVTEADVEALHNYMNNLLKESGAAVDAFYYCPHHPEHGIGRYKMTCRCRKPGTGMFEAAARELPGGIDRENSWMIGDKLIDTEAGHNFGIRSILVGTGYGSKIRKEQEAAGKLTPDGRCTDGSYDYYAANLLAAARAVVEGIC